LTRAAGVCGITCIVKVPTPCRERNLYRCNGGPTTGHPEGECPNTETVYAGDIERLGPGTTPCVMKRFRAKELLFMEDILVDLPVYVEVCRCEHKGMMKGPPCDGTSCVPHLDKIAGAQTK
jgi:hypothetical protein